MEANTQLHLARDDAVQHGVNIYKFHRPTACLVAYASARGLSTAAKRIEFNRQPAWGRNKQFLRFRQLVLSQEEAQWGTSNAIYCEGAISSSASVQRQAEKL